ncbi:MAG: VOC family protein [Solirubrobacterales bacterium]|jgi:catechol 2,3-dioxygenase-like lactoylglutathione lyase family enzyme|nr:VOC family protein [Solirubrobacterales bacterium]
MPPEIRGLDHVGVMVADLDQASRFLAETLGLELDREAEVPALDVRARFYKCGPVTIEVFEPNDPATAAAALGGAAAKLEHIAIRVEALPAALSELGEQGVRFLHDEPVVTGPNLSAYTDPASSAGMIFQLFSPKPEG